MHTEAALKTMRLPELQALYTTLTADETKSPSRPWLIRRILEAQGTAPEPTPETDVKPRTRRGKAAPADETPTDTENTTTFEPAPEGDGAEVIPMRPEPAPPVDDAPAAAPDETPAEPPSPWGAARSIADRVTHVRAVASVADLDALLAAPQTRVQAAVLAEAAKQRDALAQVEAHRDSDGEREALRARLAGNQAQVRPGVGAAIRTRLEALGAEPEVGAGDRALSGLSVEELQVRYTEVVGRPTGSSHRGYLIWKIREALKGKVTVGAVQRAHPAGEPREYKVLPLRMEAGQVRDLDAAGERLGYPSRMAMIRDALAALLEARGETEVATTLRAG